jgi:hypothetical protein
MTTNTTHTGGEPTRSLIRTPAEGPYYHPNWRLLQGEEYLRQLHTAPPGALTLQQILEGESDEFVRDLLLFHEGQPCGRAEAIAYATSWSKEDLASRAGALIRTMVLARGSAAKIAQETSTTEEKITVFEKLYFDVRPYLDCAAVVEGIYSAAVGIEKRWFTIALRHGWAGVEEAVLLRRARGRDGERNLDVAISVMLNRVEDGVVNLEASGIEPGDRDLQRLAAMADIRATGLPALWEEADELQQGHSSNPFVGSAFSKLSAGKRDCFLFLFKRLMEKLAKKVAEAEPTEALGLKDAEPSASNTSIDKPETPVSVATSADETAICE